MRKETLYRYISGESSDNENIEIMKWLEENPENEKELLSLRKIYNIGIWNVDEDIRILAKSKSAEIKSRKIALTISKIAAVLILGIIASIYIFSETKQKQTQLQIKTVEVPLGEQMELVLDDSTKVWLNSKTIMRFPEHFSGKKRIVEIDGEGYFDVTTDKKHPFVVKTLKYNIEVLGTVFNVNAYSEKDKFTASLLEGVIELSDRNKNKLFRLKPREMVSDKNGNLEKSTFEDVNQFLWKEGVISFNNESFENIIEELEKYYGVSITIEDTKILNYRITGKFRIKDGLEHILNVIQLNYKFQYKIDKNNSPQILIF